MVWGENVEYVYGFDFTLPGGLVFWNTHTQERKREKKESEESRDTQKEKEHFKTI